MTSTLFDTQLGVAADWTGTLGVIGTRQLVAVQTFDIARLTSHPVALIPSSFIAVTGRGPRDSNESGKTSFNAAVALLLGDPEWRVTGGGVAAVAELLFEPDTAGVAATRYPAAQTGFIVGVFAEPDEVEGTAYTAWMKLSSTPKYLLVRHAPGVHLVMADTDTEQHRQAPAAWASLPAASELGAQTYVDTLYGRSPRCLAYVTARGKQRSAPSLLKMDTGAFTPADIGAALMRLTGRSETLETERDQRRKLAQKTSELAEAKSDHERTRAHEEETLRGVRLRAQIRDKLAAGQHLWHQHLARGLLDTLIRRDALQAELDDARAREAESARTLAARHSAETALADDTEVAKRAASADEAFQIATQRHTDASNKVAVLTSNAATIRRELTALEEKGARDFNLDVAAATEALAASREERAKADAMATAAGEKVSALQDQLANAAAGRLGDAGRAIEILAAAPAFIEAVGLLDAVEVADDHRDLWEARLLPWRDAVCVPASVRDMALAALTHNPGSVVISGPAGDPERPRAEPGASGHLPDGLLSAPSAAVPFLTCLSERVHRSETPEAVAARDRELGVDIIGGFADPITGRAHILARLEQQRRDAQAEQGQAIDAAELAKRLHMQAEDDLAAAHAAEQYRARLADLRSVETEDLPRARDREAERKDDLDRALEDHTQAQSELRGLDAARSHARQEREEAESELSAARTEAAQPQRALEDIDLGYWLTGFAGTDSDARAALNWADDHLEADADRQIARLPGPRDPSRPVEKRTRDSLRNRANECLTEIITKLDIERATGHGSPTGEIAEAVRRREHLADSSGAPLGRDEIGFTGLADGLSEWLQHMQERDELAEEQISTARQQREAEIAFSEQRLASLASGLANIQDSLEQRIESNLTAISDALNRLNKKEGFGARLEWEVIRPAGPDDSWTWKVVPMWRRAPGGKMLPYNNATNSAQEKLFSVHLVLAALLASPNARGRVLILDELGDSLGEEHRRDVLTAVSEVAREFGITVLGTCQDAVMPDAAGYCGEILYFCYPSKAEALNLPTRMFGYDRNRQRVELTAGALLAGRPLA